MVHSDGFKWQATRLEFTYLKWATKTPEKSVKYVQS